MGNQLTKDIAEDMVLTLTIMRLRPGMFISPCTTQGLISWSGGFFQACRNFGVKFDEMAEIIEKKDWKGGSKEPFVAMKDAGLSEDEMIVVEYLTMLIQAIQIKSGLGNEIIIAHHNENRKRYEAVAGNLPESSKRILKLMDKIEADMQNDT